MDNVLRHISGICGLIVLLAGVFGLWALVFEAKNMKVSTWFGWIVIVLILIVLGVVTAYRAWPNE